MKLFARPSLRQFIRFNLVGFLSFLVDWGLYVVLTRAFSVFYLRAKVASFCVAAINSYIWNRRWTFRSRAPNRLREFSQFLLIATIGASLNAGIMYVLHGVLNIHDLIAVVLATGIVMFWNFLGNKAWTFRQTHVEPSNTSVS
jgi:putative flippase GtrA